jgi:hypothetical protein
VNAGMDALDCGLIEVGVVAAEDRARIEALEARVAAIFEMMRQTCEALGLSAPEDSAQPPMPGGAVMTTLIAVSNSEGCVVRCEEGAMRRPSPSATASLAVARTAPRNSRRSTTRELAESWLVLAVRTARTSPTRNGAGRRKLVR